MSRQHHPAVSVLLWLLTLACVVSALMSTGFAAIVAAIFVLALRVEAGLGGVDVEAQERQRRAAKVKYEREWIEYAAALKREREAKGEELI
jgi:hypothetical protein